jgi:hypothetical protein
MNTAIQTHRVSEGVSGANQTAMREIDDRIRDMIEGAPSDASVELLVHKTPTGFKGLLKVNSTQRRFVGGFQAPSFNEVVDRIFQEVQEQIEAWKLSRPIAIQD